MQQTFVQRIPHRAVVRLGSGQMVPWRALFAARLSHREGRIAARPRLGTSSGRIDERRRADGWPAGGPLRPLRSWDCTRRIDKLKQGPCSDPKGPRLDDIKTQ